MTRRAIREGELKFRLLGERLRGRYTIVRTSGRGGRRDERDQWLLIKKRDEASAAGWDAEDYPASVKTGRTNDEVKDGVPPRFEQPAPSPDVAPDLSMAREERQPDFVPPMMATLTDAAFDDDDWLYEVKWDGYRVEAVVSGGKARIWTRNRVDAATYFPNLAGPPAGSMPSRRSWMARWSPSTRRAGRRSAACRKDRAARAGDGHRRADPDAPKLTREQREAIPMAYMVFDLLHLDGRSLVDDGAPQAPAAARAAAGRAGALRLARGGRRRRLHAGGRREGLEGIVAKRRLSPYQPNRRSRDWAEDQAAPRAGDRRGRWLPGQGTHKDLGSLIVAVNDDGGLRHAGQVGSGINARMRKELLAAMEPIRRRTLRWSRRPGCRSRAGSSRGS